MKQKIFNRIIQLLDQQIQTAESAIASAIESRDNETKSSVGDKYETGRAMMQLEQQKGEVQLAKAITLKKTVEQINLEQNFDAARFGALVHTTNGIFFLSIGMGKVKVAEEVILVISMSSPIGQLILGKRKGEQFIFQKREITILAII